MTDPHDRRKYFESILLGNGARKSKEDIARRALLEFDSIDRVLVIHKSTRGDESKLCESCQVTYPCQTRRALTGE